MQEKDIIQSFLDYLKYEKRYSRHTIISYETDLRDCFDFITDKFGETSLKDITAGLVRSWLASLKENDISSRSISRKIATLRSFFKYHLKSGAIEASPMVNITSPKISKRLPVFVKEDEAKKLLETAKTATESWKTLNARMLLLLFYNTGMRLSELISLREQQVDAARAQVKVLGKGNKERIIPLSREILTAIKDYNQLKRKEFEKTEEYLLVTEKGKKLYPKYAYLLVNEYLKGAGTLEKKSPHVLRHTFATHLMNHGADLNAVKELLGHSSLAATQVYTHNTIEKLKNIHKKAHPKG
jgi:integrase/recombinase XerC